MDLAEIKYWIVLLCLMASIVPDSDCSTEKKHCPQLELDCRLCHRESHGKCKLPFVKQTKKTTFISAVSANNLRESMNETS